MRSYRKKRNTALLFCFILLAVIAACVFGFVRLLSEPKEEPDPHAGQVYLYDGFDWIWMTPLEGVPVNELTEEKFSSSEGQINYIGDEYDVLRGIDVSDHQGHIDWSDVAAADIDFAYIRAGRRGYTEGGLHEDERFKTNLANAKANGLKVGVYFFSQAVSVSEAIAEAQFLLNSISRFDIDLPIAFDWETIEDEKARTANVTTSTRTDCAVAFCETIKRAGYTPCVYFNRNIGYYGYDLTRLTDYMFWFALPESGFPNFYYACDMWQYSFTDEVPGISGGTDMNLWFIPKAETELPVNQ